MQEDQAGQMRPVAYFSRENLPAECNYDIGDKEMLAIIQAFEEWQAELKSVQKFTILTDHKNLEKFMTKRRLTERQARWAQLLDNFHFKLSFRSGKLAEAPDALSRREQDRPQTEDDEWVAGRELCAINPRTKKLNLLRAIEYKGRDF